MYVENVDGISIVDVGTNGGVGKDDACWWCSSLSLVALVGCWFIAGVCNKVRTDMCWSCWGFDWIRSPCCWHSSSNVMVIFPILFADASAVGLITLGWRYRGGCRRRRWRRRHSWFFHITIVVGTDWEPLFLLSSLPSPRCRRFAAAVILIGIVSDDVEGEEVMDAFSVLEDILDLRLCWCPSPSSSPSCGWFCCCCCCDKPNGMVACPISVFDVAIDDDGQRWPLW